MTPRPAAGRPPARRSQARGQALVVGLAAVAVLVVAVVAWGGGDGPDAGNAGPPAAAPTPEGLRTYQVSSRDHVSGPVDYPQRPPVGGDHDATWQNCGLYTEPIVTERGVHSLEHGAVWVTHRAGLAADQVEALRRLAAGQTHILVSPWDGELASSIVASAWGRQLALASATDPGLAEFVRAFRIGPQTPEPGAPCTGGRSTPR